MIAKQKICLQQRYTAAQRAFGSRVLRQTLAIGSMNTMYRTYKRI
jgi:hypothetical protein